MTKPSVRLYTPTAQKERERERECRKQNSYKAKPGTEENMYKTTKIYSQP
jgi:hypothetical protein